MKIREHMKLLGMRVADKVTGQTGVVTSISFDLFGCIQAVVVPPIGKDGVQPDGGWFDVRRLNVTGSLPVMPAPDFEAGYIAEGRKGAADKPARSW